ncbi:MAG: HAD family phosphatase [Bacilli bacterium]|nr:HAD family phosphatase [Bacilli bacterium]
MEFNGNKILLAIFDLDGTLADSTSLWSDIDRIFFARRNKEVPLTYGEEIAHIGLKAAAKLTKAKYLPDEEEIDILNEWHELSLQAYKDTIPLKPYAREVLESLKEEGVTIALATANSKELYLPLLERTSIANHFSLIKDVSSCKLGKDSPEIYEMVRSYFGVSSSNTLVIEDSLVALKTAKSHGYNVIGVYDKNTVTDIEASKSASHLYIHSLKELLDII